MLAPTSNLLQGSKGAAVSTFPGCQDLPKPYPLTLKPNPNLTLTLQGPKGAAVSTSPSSQDPPSSRAKDKVCGGGGMGRGLMRVCGGERQE